MTEQLTTTEKDTSNHLAETLKKAYSALSDAGRGVDMERHLPGGLDSIMAQMETLELLCRMVHLKILTIEQPERIEELEDRAKSILSDPNTGEYLGHIPDPQGASPQIRRALRSRSRTSEIETAVKTILGEVDDTDNLDVKTQEYHELHRILSDYVHRHASTVGELTPEVSESPETPRHSTT